MSDAKSNQKQIVQRQRLKNYVNPAEIQKIIESSRNLVVQINCMTGINDTNEQNQPI